MSSSPTSSLYPYRCRTRRSTLRDRDLRWSIRVRSKHLKKTRVFTHFFTNTGLVAELYHESKTGRIREKHRWQSTQDQR